MTDVNNTSYCAEIAGRLVPWDTWSKDA